MKPNLARSFIFNRYVIGLLIGACFVVTALNIYLDSVLEDNIIFSAVQIAESNVPLLSKMSPDQIESLQSDHFSIKPFNSDDATKGFLKNAYESLSQDPTKPYYVVVFDSHSQFAELHYAAKLPSGFYELTIPLTDLRTFVEKQSTETLWVLVLLAIVSIASLVVFFGAMRWKGEVLIDTQQRALEYQKALTQAYGRFFPHQFLDLLDKKSILDVHLGDQVAKQMVVVFADIRNFTSKIEHKTPAESFKIINDYLLGVSPIIRMNNGFIDKYIGDAIMALFVTPDDAIAAFSKIMEFLNQSSLDFKEIGVGMHVGPLMVGTVGEIERMDGTVISDVVNTASRLEPLNKSYGTHILVSEEMLNQMADRTKYKIRFIDHIYAKGKKEGLKVYEIYNTDPPELIQKKDAMQEIWNRAVECYRNRQFKEALELFNQCKGIYPEDKTVYIYLMRTGYLIENPPNESWTPIAQLSQKDEVH